MGAAALLVSERLGPEALLQTIERERPSMVCAAPALYPRMLQVETAHDLARLGAYVALRPG